MGDFLTGDIGGASHACMPPVTGKLGDRWTCECGQNWTFSKVAGHSWESWQRV
ncbi:MAG: hypothetical protein VXA38_04905 [Aquiluna sp.]